MVIVLIAARYKRLIEWIHLHDSQDICSISVIKRVGPKVFLYIETTLDFISLIRIFQNTINHQGGIAYVYQFYPLYNGMIDYHMYLMDETKNITKYYLSEQKDLDSDELEDFLQSQF